MSACEMYAVKALLAMDELPNLLEFTFKIFISIWIRFSRFWTYFLQKIIKQNTFSFCSYFGSKIHLRRRMFLPQGSNGYNPREIDLTSFSFMECPARRRQEIDCWQTNKLRASNKGKDRGFEIPSQPPDVTAH